MQIERVVQLRPGVQIEDEVYVDAVLDVCIPVAAQGLAIENGLVNSSWAVRTRAKKREIPIPWIGATMSRELPTKPVAAVFATVTVQARGLFPLALAAATGLVVGVLMSYWWLVGVGSLVITTNLSFVIHEAGHALTFRIVGGTDAKAVIVNRGTPGHLVRGPLTTGRDAVVVISGPLAPLLAIIPMLSLWWVSPVIVVGWMAIGAGHALSLLLPVGDGANLRQVLASAPPGPG